jgi:hypothetical protein
MHTQDNGIGMIMLYPHTSTFQVHLWICTTYQWWPMWLSMFGLFKSTSSWSYCHRMNWRNIFIILHSFNVFSHICSWYVTCYDIPYIPKTLPSFVHQNKGGCILNMNMFQWANHGVFQYVSHLFFTQVQAQIILKQINYSRWVHIFTCQCSWKCFIIATN